MDLVRTVDHPEAYDAQPPRPLTTVEGLYDWLRDQQFRCVVVCCWFFFFVCGIWGVEKKRLLA